MSIGKKVSMLQTKLGYSSKDLAQKAEISPSMLSQIKKDGKGASITTIANLAKALYTTSDYLLDLSDDYIIVIAKDTDEELYNKIIFLINNNNSKEDKE